MPIPMAATRAMTMTITVRKSAGGMVAKGVKRKVIYIFIFINI